jgi:hypothetical protein
MSEVEGVMDTICSNCGTANPPDRMTCSECGEQLDPTLMLPVEAQLTEDFGDKEIGQNVPRWGDSRFTDDTVLQLRIIEPEQTLVLDIHAGGSVVLGRGTATQETVTRMDLSPFGAHSKGVSRNHARLELKNYSLYLTDLNSTNWTYLNGLRLAAKQPRIVRDGDFVDLGQLKCQVLFGSGDAK